MATSLRKQVRLSLLALLVSYLRDGVTTVSNFPTYPSEQDVYSFTTSGELYQIAAVEVGQPMIDPGVTVIFGADRAMPETYDKKWEVEVRIEIAVQRSWVGDSMAQEIAELIDAALYKAARVQIVDWLAATPTGSGLHLQWDPVIRGEWQMLDAAAGYDHLALDFAARYQTAAAV